MDIIEKAKSLNLPFGQYIIIGAGILQALGLRDTNDIDVVVTESLFEKLKASGKYKEDVKYNKKFLVADDVEITMPLSWADYSTTTEEAIKTALVIEGIPFLNIQETIKFKTALGREQDFKDIELLKNYARAKNN